VLAQNLVAQDVASGWYARENSQEGGVGFLSGLLHRHAIDGHAYCNGLAEI
jgi:hypothetical protein